MCVVFKCHSADEASFAGNARELIHIYSGAEKKDPSNDSFYLRLARAVFTKD